MVAGQKPTDFRTERFDRESKRVMAIVGPGGDARGRWRALLS